MTELLQQREFHKNPQLTWALIAHKEIAGSDCVWQASLGISFGARCIPRVLDLSLVESRPELWRKYTYVLSRLQGFLEPAFSKPLKPITGFSCLEKACPVAKPMPAASQISVVSCCIDVRLEAF